MKRIALPLWAVLALFFVQAPKDMALKPACFPGKVDSERVQVAQSEAGEDIEIVTSMCKMAKDTRWGEYRIGGLLRILVFPSLDIQDEMMSVMKYFPREI